MLSGSAIKIKCKSVQHSASHAALSSTLKAQHAFSSSRHECSSKSICTTGKLHLHAKQFSSFLLHEAVYNDDPRSARAPRWPFCCTWRFLPKSCPFCPFKPPPPLQFPSIYTSTPSKMLYSGSAASSPAAAVSTFSRRACSSSRDLCKPSTLLVMLVMVP